MSRRLVALPDRRPTRSRVASRRFEHGHDLVALAPGADHAPPAGAGLEALILENATLARELGRVQQRCTRWRDHCTEQVERAQAQLMNARAAAVIKVTEIAALREAVDALECDIAMLRQGRLRPAHPAPFVREALDAPLASSSSARRVLCVGGRSRQVPIYRELVERLGGHFLHASGTPQDPLADLEKHLACADLVILQAGYACQDACRAVERHCARTGTRCVWLDKPCVIGFERGLSQALGLRS